VLSQYSLHSTDTIPCHEIKPTVIWHPTTKTKRQKRLGYFVLSHITNTSEKTVFELVDRNKVLKEIISKIDSVVARNIKPGS
jgi:hypothetical protein